MIVWPPKDPDEVLDFSWLVPLDAGDTISSYSVAVTTGDVILDSDDRIDGKVVGWLSGGTAGTSSSLTLRAATAGGRTFEETATIAIVSSANPLLGEFMALYPAFSGVPSSTVSIWLKRSEKIVGDSWADLDRDDARMLLAAHNMAVLGLDRPSGDAVGGMAQMGVTGFRSASMSVNFDAETIQNANSSRYSSTKYGQMFLPYLRRNLGGPRLVGCA